MKCIELCVECAEYIPCLSAVAFFLPGLANDLSAHPRTCVTNLSASPLHYTGTPTDLPAQSSFLPSILSLYLQKK